MARVAVDYGSAETVNREHISISLNLDLTCWTTRLSKCQNLSLFHPLLEFIFGNNGVGLDGTEDCQEDTDFDDLNSHVLFFSV